MATTSICNDAGRRKKAAKITSSGRVVYTTWFRKMKPLPKGAGDHEKLLYRRVKYLYQPGKTMEWFMRMAGTKVAREYER
jgi:hypothetical protein